MIMLLALATVLSLITAVGAAVVASRAYRLAETSATVSRISIGNAADGDRTILAMLHGEQQRIDQIVRVLDLMSRADILHLEQLGKTLRSMTDVDRELLVQGQRTDLDVRHLQAVVDSNS